MEQVIIGTKNQIVIPRQVRSKIKGLRPGRKVTIYSKDLHTLIVKVDEGTWLESSYGLMKNAWEKLDPITLIDQSRDQW